MPLCIKCGQQMGFGNIGLSPMSGMCRACEKAVKDFTGPSRGKKISAKRFSVKNGKKAKVGF